jgi:hypothetical protein
VNVLEAIDDLNLLGASIKDPVSFAPWKALLAGAFGLPLDPDQLDLYRHCTGRTAPPSAPFRSVFMSIGRRGGKSVCMALMAVAQLDEKQALQALKDDMARRMKTGGEPRPEYQLTEAEKRMIDAGLARYRILKLRAPCRASRRLRAPGRKL